MIDPKKGRGASSRRAHQPEPERRYDALAEATRAANCSGRTSLSLAGRRR